jgi:hypothetical protein
MKSHKNQKNQKICETTLPPKGVKPTNVGKQLVQRTKNLTNNIGTVMKKSDKSKTESFDMDNDLVMRLDCNGDSIRVEFFKFLSYYYYNPDNFYMILDVEMDVKKLKKMTDFINNYLEKNND